MGFAQNGAKIEFTAKDNTIDYGKVTKAMIMDFELLNLQIQEMLH